MTKESKATLYFLVWFVGIGIALRALFDYLFPNFNLMYPFFTGLIVAAFTALIVSYIAKKYFPAVFNQKIFGLGGKVTKK